MNLSGIALVAGIALSAVAATPVVAQDRVEVHRTVTTTRTTMAPRHHRWHRKKVCRTHWYNHHRVKRCYWRRY